MLFLRITHLTVQQNKHAQRKAESAAAHRLLAELAEELALPEARIVTASKGRPYFEGLPSVDFNLSHASGLAVCALSHREGAVASRVGVDVEGTVTYTESKIATLTARFFGECERAFVANATDKAIAFTEVFTRKEAFAKYTGEGLGRHWSGTDTLHPDFERTHGVRFFTYPLKGHTLCLCASLEEQAPPCTVKD